MSPINISYDLSYSPLEDNSFQINVMKKTNGILDPTILPINKKFFSSNTYLSLVELDLHAYQDLPLTIDYDNNKNQFSYIYELCDFAFTNSRKSITLQRYKGLGEMNPSQLAETTMNPSSRSLLQVSQIEDDDYIIFDTLMGDDVEKRRDFIVSSASTVGNVDV